MRWRYLFCGEILNEAMIVEANDNQIQKENVRRNILSNNIRFVSVYYHLDQGTK